LIDGSGGGRGGGRGGGNYGSMNLENFNKNSTINSCRPLWRGFGFIVALEGK